LYISLKILIIIAYLEVTFGITAAVYEKQFEKPILGSDGHRNGWSLYFVDGFPGKIFV